jgi:hypothetical protein
MKFSKDMHVECESNILMVTIIKYKFLKISNVRNFIILNTFF